MIRNKFKVLLAEKSLRENRAISFQTAAGESGIPKSVLSLYSAQKVKRFDAETLEKMCSYLECSISEFLVEVR